MGYKHLDARLAGGDDFLQKMTALEHLRTALATVAGGVFALAVLSAGGCKVGIPGLTPATRQPSSAPLPVADLQGHLGPSYAGAPYLASVMPPDAGPGAVVRLTGQNLAQAGLKVFFGPLAASSMSVVASGQVAVEVPVGARSGPLGVAVASASVASSRPFQVISVIGANLLDSLPGAVGKPLHLALSAIDTAGAPVASPDVKLVVEPPGAARVTGYGQVTPLQMGTFTIQAVSGSVVQTVQSAACPNFVPVPFAGDGTPSYFVSPDGSSDFPILNDLASGTPGVEAGTALQAHLNKPGGLVRFTYNGKTGVLISDTGVGRLRFVPDDGSSIQTVVGGGTQIPPNLAEDGHTSIAAAGVGIPANQVQLFSPAGLAVGTWWDQQTPFVAIAEQGRHDILAWVPSTDRVVRLAGTGLPVTTDQSTNSNLTTSLGDQDTGNGVPGLPIDAGFTDPTAVAIAPAPGTNGSEIVLYVADTGDFRIRRILLSGQSAADNIITTMMGTGAASGSLLSGNAASSSVDFPQGIAVLLEPPSQTPVVYVADTDDNRVVAITGDTHALSADNTYGVQPVMMDVAHPVGIDATMDGTIPVIAVADTRNDRIVVAEPNIQTNSSLEVGIASCNLDADPAYGIVWPQALMFKQFTSGVPGSEQILFSDFFSDQVRELDIKNSQ